jgi:hypothetical protein
VIRCDHCHERPPRHVAWDLPENEGGLLMGDELLGVLLCDACLAVTAADGPWDGVEALEAA